MSGHEGHHEGADEETKAKFREALEKKHAHGGADVTDGHDRSKVHGAHGPAKQQHMFRRRAGS
jgi:hypothetical protein